MTTDIPSPSSTSSVPKIELRHLRKLFMGSLESGVWSLESKDKNRSLTSDSETPDPRLQTYNGTLTVFIISLSTASASSLRRREEEKRELTTRRCAKTGSTRRLMSSGTQ